MKHWMFYAAVVLTLAGLLGFPPQVRGQTETVVSLLPETISLDPGETALIEITIADVDDLWGFDVLVRFDPQKIEIIDYSFGTFLDPGLEWIEDDEPDYLQFVRAQPSDSTPKSGGGLLASFTITASDSPGTTLLEISSENVILSDIDGGEILCQLSHTHVTITGEEEAQPFKVFLPLVMRQ